MSCRPAITPPIRRVPLLLGAMLCLLLGLWAGLLRVGWAWPAVPAMAVAYHGPLMVGGFLGTMIGLERAVALRRWWWYGAPVASVAGAAALLAGVPPHVGAGLLVLASGVLVAAFVRIIRQQPAVFTVVMGIAAVCWAVGNAIWMAGQFIPAAVPWWVAFLVLTIVGERLELCRFLPRTRARQPTFVVAAGVYLGGVVAGWWWAGLGWAVAGVGLAALAAWLAAYDLARRTVRQQGLTRFAAVCLLSGYFWLAVGGGLAVWYEAAAPLVGGRGSMFLRLPLVAGMAYDAVLHAVLLGFVFAMIFGHAPIIFPAVLGIRMEYRPRLYSHLVLLQGSVGMRIACDLGGWWGGRQWAGLLNVCAVLLFLLNTGLSVRGRAAPAGPAVPPRGAGGGKPVSLAVNVPPARPA
jgi:hypothetical protein